MEALYVTEKTAAVGRVVLGKLTKDGPTYIYEPAKEAKYSTFEWTKQPFVSTLLPVFVAQRIMTPYNTNIGAHLEKLGLQEYDEWEVLKRTKEHLHATR